MKNKIIYMVVGVLAIAASVLQEQGVFELDKKPLQTEINSSGDQVDDDDYKKLVSSIEQQKSDVQVKGSGTVIKVLKDDNEGSRHQRFLIDIGGGNTLLIAHNIDLAPRVEGLTEGDEVAFYGEYEWNNKGGVVHWTHHDPGGRHVGGWLQHKGKTFQ